MKDHIETYRQSVRAAHGRFKPNSGEVFRDPQRLNLLDVEGDTNDQYLTSVRCRIGEFSLDMDIWMHDVVVCCIGHGILVDNITLLDRPSADGLGFLQATLKGTDPAAVKILMNDLCDRSAPIDPEQVIFEGSGHRFLGTGRPLSYKFVLSYHAMMEKPDPYLVHRLAVAGLLTVKSPRSFDLDTMNGAAQACERQLISSNVVLNADQAAAAFPELVGIAGWTSFRQANLISATNIHDTMQRLFEVFGGAPALAPSSDEEPESEPVFR